MEVLSFSVFYESSFFSQVIELFQLVLQKMTQYGKKNQFWETSKD